MLYFGELCNKLKTSSTKEERFRLLDNNMNGSLAKFLMLYSNGQEFVDSLKGVDVLYEDSPYGRTISNFYREFTKILYFRKEIGQNMPTEKLKDMLERSMLQMTKEESQLLVSWIRGESFWPQTIDEIKEYLGVKK